jgi:hypothetical protein
MKTCQVHDVLVKIGDVVAFKSDYEQWGRVIGIRQGTDGPVLVLENTHGFDGHYIGGSTITTQLARDCWAD